MTIDLGLGNPMPTPTATLFIAREGKVYYQYDYWDTVGGLAQIYPPLHTAYEWAVAIFLGGGRMLEASGSAERVTVSPVRTAGMSPHLVRFIES
jgi:hypothetical protein